MGFTVLSSHFLYGNCEAKFSKKIQTQTETRGLLGELIMDRREPIRKSDRAGSVQRQRHESPAELRILHAPAEHLVANVQYRVDVLSQQLVPIASGRANPKGERPA